MSEIASSLKRAQSSLGTGLEVESIDDSARLAELRNEWFKLWAELPDGTPFQSPDWLLSWWRHYGEGSIFSFAFRHDGRLVGLAPFYIYKNGETRHVFLIGTGNTDYLDVIVHPGFRSVCREMLVFELERGWDLWDECGFQQLRSSSLLLELRDIGQLGFEVHQQEPCLALDLHHLNHSRTVLKRVAEYQRRLEKRGSFRIEEATPESFDEIFETLKRLHEDRWRTADGSSACNVERDWEFHRSAALAFLKSGMLKLYGARFNGKIVGALDTFRHLKRTYVYLTAFDREYAPYSIGTIILGHSIEDSRRQGCDVVDFLRGTETHKYRWGAREQATFSVRALKKSVQLCG